VVPVGVEDVDVLVVEVVVPKPPPPELPPTVVVPPPVPPDPCGPPPVGTDGLAGRPAVGAGRETGTEYVRARAKALAVIRGLSAGGGGSGRSAAIGGAGAE
jgi:hypothetical protein